MLGWYWEFASRVNIRVMKNWLRVLGRTHTYGLKDYCFIINEL